MQFFVLFSTPAVFFFYREVNLDERLIMSAVYIDF